MALAILKKDILIEAEFYEGDFLSAIMETEDGYILQLELQPNKERDDEDKFVSPP